MIKRLSGRFSINQVMNAVTSIFSSSIRFCLCRHIFFRSGIFNNSSIFPNMESKSLGRNE